MTGSNEEIPTASEAEIAALDAEIAALDAEAAKRPSIDLLRQRIYAADLDPALLNDIREVFLWAEHQRHEAWVMDQTATALSEDLAAAKQALRARELAETVPVPELAERCAALDLELRMVSEELAERKVNERTAWTILAGRFRLPEETIDLRSGDPMPRPLAIICEILVDLIEHTPSATNYFGFGWTKKDTGKGYNVIVQRAEGKPPQQVAAEAQAERDALQAELNEIALMVEDGREYDLATHEERPTTVNERTANLLDGLRADYQGAKETIAALRKDCQDAQNTIARLRGRRVMFKPFMVDFSSLGFHTFETVEQFHAWVAKARQDKDWRGDDFVLDARNAPPEVVANVQRASMFATDTPFGYGLDPNIPTFGYRREHKGVLTLREWLAANEIPWPLT